MSFSVVFRSARAFVVALVVYGVVVPLGAQAPEPLFDEVSAQVPVAPDTRDLQPFHIRNRTAALRVATLQRALAAPSTSAFTLNVFDDVSLPVTFERVEDSGHGQQTWVGHVTNQPLSTVTLTLNGDIISGRIFEGTTRYEIESIGGGVHRIDQLDTTLMPQGRDSVLPVPPSAQDQVRAQQGDLASPAAVPAVDVLVYYSTGVRVQQGGEAQAQAMVARLFAESNTAYARSGIPAQLRLLAALEVPAPDGANDEELLPVLQAHPTARGQRDLAGADLVALLLTHLAPHPVPGLIKCGLAYIGPGSEFAYSITATRSECDSIYSFTHEIGHNLGAQHATEDGVLTGSEFPTFARGFKAANHAFHTVMAYECSTAPACPVILNFSNPNVPSGGQPTGTATQFNALRLAQLFGTVASYRAARIPPSAPQLHGSATGSTVNLSWLSPPVGGAPTDYLIDAGTAPGLSNILAGLPFGDTSLSAGGIPSGNYFIRVRARNGGGVSGPSNEILVVVH